MIVGGTDVLILPNMPGRGPCVRRVLTDSDAVITVSDGLKTACDALGAASGRVVTIRQGIDPEVFHVGDQVEARRRLGLIEARGERREASASTEKPEALIVWVGRMVGLKRVDLLIQATRMLKEQGRRVRVCLLGSARVATSGNSSLNRKGWRTRFSSWGPSATISWPTGTGLRT